MNRRTKSNLPRYLKIVLGCAQFILLACAPHASAVNHTQTATPISEHAYVPIGGIDQWITIQGENKTNPIVLVVHGGPGNPLSPVADSLFKDWEQDFTIVQWDQRGAGRTFMRSGRSVAPTMNVERLAQDGIEVAEYLIKHLGQEKVFVFASSWGAVLGVQMVHARPDLFHAYIGHSQIVEWNANLAATYDRLLGLAVEADDQFSIDTLTELNPPPWPHMSRWPRFRTVYRHYQRAAATAPEPKYEISADYASDEEQALRFSAENFSFEVFWGLKLSGPLFQVDLPALGDRFDVPMFFVHGEQDLWTIPELSFAYYEMLKAPEKNFYFVEGTGHDYSIESLALVRNIILSRVK